MTSKIPLVVGIGLLATGGFMVFANMWFDKTFSFDLSPQPTVNPTLPPETTPMVTIIPYNSPTPNLNKTPSNKHIMQLPTITPPRSTPLPTNTPIPQNIQITATFTTQIYICTEDIADKARTIIGNAEQNIAPIDAQYTLCTGIADENAQSCVDSCGVSLACMQNCGISTDETYQSCTTIRDNQKDPLVTVAISEVSKICFVVE
ncbi:hypothetical protein GW793_01750 [bacterium]|uniref:Uncharacterized protein n=2 Tax=Katanobacteria TaxID=422282 RepID=A0A2M7X1T0_UNCKA|nr:hypothetical protein [bacterium]PIP56789.1 MAG: hypothetical protein COX05_01175 [candidate division WWE3 bacterium CG22_combo_CG10-13_8_21_14_all_39_12]PJA40136.1 MAG: hypothetical protein CO179_03230 [candidate division WWE3 bacterium CG_4_9_14_3_um_filter_39_7]